MGLLIFLLVIGYPALEIYVLIKVGGHIGLVNTVFALLSVGVLGAGLAKAQGRALHEDLQRSLARGQAPTSSMLQGLLVFVGGVLFLIPGFVSDVIGLFFVMPGSRHLIAYLLRRKLEQKMRSGQGQFRVFTSGPFGAGGFGAGGGFGGFGGRNPFDSADAGRDEDDQVGRDVTPKVIDVTPISKSKVEDEPSGKGH